MTVRVAYLSLVGSFCFILRFLLDSWKDNLVILAIESLFPYERLILLDSCRNNITNLVIKCLSLSKTNSLLLRIIVLRRTRLRDPWINILYAVGRPTRGLGDFKRDIGLSCLISSRMVVM